MDVSEIAAFVAARCREDGEISTSATHPWFDAKPLVGVAGFGYGDAAHIVRWGPRRAIDVTVTIRQVVERCERASKSESSDAVELAANVVKILAEIYALHPDYREEWILEDEDAPSPTSPVQRIVRIAPYPRPELRRAENVAKIPEIKPSTFAVGDRVSVVENSNTMWAGIVVSKTSEDVIIRYVADVDCERDR